MSETKTGGPAFPTGTFEYDGSGNVLPYQEAGMTLRDYFAAKALQGLLASRGFNNFEKLESAGYYARAAYRAADDMLEQRGK